LFFQAFLRNNVTVHVVVLSGLCGKKIEIKANQNALLLPGSFVELFYCNNKKNLERSIHWIFCPDWPITFKDEDWLVKKVTSYTIHKQWNLS